MSSLSTSAYLRDGTYLNVGDYEGRALQALTAKGASYAIRKDNPEYLLPPATTLYQFFTPDGELIGDVPLLTRPNPHSFLIPSAPLPQALTYQIEEDRDVSYTRGICVRLIFFNKHGQRVADIRYNPTTIHIYTAMHEFTPTQYPSYVASCNSLQQWLAEQGTKGLKLDFTSLQDRQKLDAGIHELLNAPTDVSPGLSALSKCSVQ